MTADLLFRFPAAEAVSWALLHLVWQGTLVAAIAAVLFALLEERSANARYVVGCAALALMLALPVATAIRISNSDGTATPSVMSGESASRRSVPIGMAAAAEALRESAAKMLAPVVPWTFAGWLTGVAFLLLRFAGGWLAARRLLRSTQAASAAWQRRINLLSSRMGLERVAALVESASHDVPMVIGWLRPVIVLPASALAGLTPLQLETILAHELAHIRRHDYLVNLLQGLVETLLFYHPAVWWLSHRVRVERENCCDDIAVEMCGSAVLYARALADLEEGRHPLLNHAVAASGGSLKGRIMRLLSNNDGTSRCSYRFATGASVFALVTLLFIVAPLSLFAAKHTFRVTTAARHAVPPAPPAVPPAPPAPAAVAPVPPVRALATPPAPPTPPSPPRAHSDAEIDVVAPPQVEAPEPPEPPSAPELGPDDEAAWSREIERSVADALRAARPALEEARLEVERAQRELRRSGLDAHEIEKIRRQALREAEKAMKQVHIDRHEMERIRTEALANARAEMKRAHLDRAEIERIKEEALASADVARELRKERRKVKCGQDEKE